MMDNIITLFQKRFKTLSLLTLSLSFCIALLVIRMKITQTMYFRFLIWNLFLAIVPYAITTYLVSLKKIRLIKLVVYFIIWLLFLPNAPYIITDLLHLKVSSSSMLWLDVLMISFFAINGLLLFYLSLLDFKAIVEQHLNTTTTHIIIIIVLLLTSFGMYLGRFLRYNSWEILSNINHLFTDIINILLLPKQHYNAWLFTICFGFALNIGYVVFKNIKTDIK